MDPTLNEDAYFRFCSQYRHARIERDARGAITIRPPVGLETSYQEAEAGAQLREWARRDGRGKAFGSNVEFILPNGAALSPDASWVPSTAIANLTRKQKRQFPPLCPSFVIELRPPRDRLSVLKSKMQEWIDNGVQLAWFIDGQRHTVTIYRQDREPEVLVNPDVVIGEGPVKGFRLKMADIWAGL